MPPITFKTGEKVLVTLDGRTVRGQILLASANGRALVVTFEAVLGEGADYAGMMPVREEGGLFYELFRDREIGLQRLGVN